MDNPVDNVNHPSHYGGKDDPYEAVKVIEAWDLGFHLGNTVKYICRAGRKVVARRLEDLQKAAWYLARMIALLTIGENRRKSSHQQRVEDFMGNAGHYVPLWPMTPTPDVRLLRARLIMEEAMETVEALGVEIMISDGLTDRNSMKFSRLPANALCFVDTRARTATG